VARYSIPKLLSKATVSWIMTGVAIALVSASLAKAGSITFTLAGAAGVLMFGAIGAVHTARLFDRRVQVIIDARGLYIRAHGNTRIALRSIEQNGAHWDRLSLTPVLPLREPSVHGRFAKPTNSGNLSVRDTPLGIEGMGCHPELTAAVKLK